MPNWRLTTMNLHELVRRLRVHESDRAISRALGVSRNTVKDYRQWAEAHRLLEGDLLDLASLEALRRQSPARPAPDQPTQVSSVEAYRAEIADELAQGRQPRTIWRLLEMWTTAKGAAAHISTAATTMVPTAHDSKERQNAP